MPAWLWLQGIVFAVWACLMFHSLFRLLAFHNRTGGGFASPVRMLEVLLAFLRRSDYAADRRRLGVATLVLVLVQAVTVAVY